MLKNCLVFFTLTCSSLGFSQVAKPTNELSVIWWNTACSGIENTKDAPLLAANLKKLAEQSTTTDLLILGEHCPDKLDSETLKELKQAYPYNEFVPYNSALPNSGIGIFSTQPYKTFRGEELDWVPAKACLEDQEKVRKDWDAATMLSRVFKRNFTEIEIEKAGKTYKLYPIQLLNPWQRYLQNGASLSSKVTIVTKLLTSHQTPLNYQLENYLARVLERNPEAEKNKVILIGDFNFPKKIVFETTEHATVREHFQNAMQTNEPTHTQSDLKIDHVFINTNVESTFDEVISMSGSDHLPIRVRLK